jgi:hypothetical protein
MATISLVLLPAAAAILLVLAAVKSWRRLRKELEADRARRISLTLGLGLLSAFAAFHAAFMAVTP